MLAAVYFVIVLFIFDPSRTNVGASNDFMLISTRFVLVLPVEILADVSVLRFRLCMYCH